MQSEWSNLIRQYRLRFGLTQQDLGYMLGVSQKTISRWESGENKPSLRQQSQFVDSLRAPSSTIFNALSASVRNCPAQRGLISLQNLTLLAVSPPAIIRRPLIVNWIGRGLLPIANGVVAEMLDDRELRRNIAKGEIACVRAITRRILKLPEYPAVGTYQTTISFFRIDGSLIGDVISMPAPADSKPGYWAVPTDMLPIE